MSSIINGAQENFLKEYGPFRSITLHEFSMFWPIFSMVGQHICPHGQVSPHVKMDENTGIP